MLQVLECMRELALEPDFGPVAAVALELLGAAVVGLLLLAPRRTHKLLKLLFSVFELVEEDLLVVLAQLQFLD